MNRTKKHKKGYILVIAIYILTGLTITSFSKDESRTRGPLITNNLYPFYLGFINSTPDRAKPLNIGETTVQISNNYANTFNWDREGLADGFLMDMDLENSRTTFRIDYGISKRISIGMETSYNVLYGGIFDSVIQGFHDIFGFPNAGREMVENNLFNISIANEAGYWFNYNEPVYGLSDLVLHAKLNLISKKNNGLYLSVKPAIKIPVWNNESILSSGQIDYEVLMLAEKTGINYGAYLSLGWMHLTKPENLQIFDFNGDLFSFMFSYEWMAFDAWSFFAQVDGNTSPYISGNKRLDHFSATINLGFKCDIFEKGMLQVSFSEEFFTFATTDIALMAAIIFRI